MYGDWMKAFAPSSFHIGQDEVDRRILFLALWIVMLLIVMLLIVMLLIVILFIVILFIVILLIVILLIVILLICSMSRFTLVAGTPLPALLNGSSRQAGGGRS